MLKPSRASFARRVLLTLIWPNDRSDHGPHSPLVAGFRRSQSGTKFPRRGSPTGNVLSFHDRVVLADWFDEGISTATPVLRTGYRPSATLSAVLPVPNRS